METKKKEMRPRRDFLAWDVVFSIEPISSGLILTHLSLFLSFSSSSLFSSSSSSLFSSLWDARIFFVRDDFPPPGRET